MYGRRTNMSRSCYDSPRTGADVPDYPKDMKPVFGSIRILMPWQEIAVCHHSRSGDSCQLVYPRSYVRYNYEPRRTVFWIMQYTFFFTLYLHSLTHEAMGYPTDYTLMEYSVALGGQWSSSSSWWWNTYNARTSSIHYSPAVCTEKYRPPKKKKKKKKKKD